MTSLPKNCACGVFFCFLSLFVINPKTYALEKKVYTALDHYIMALRYEKLDDSDNAILEYKKALSLDYKNSLIHLNLAVSYIKKNLIPEAIKELKIATELSPGIVEPHAILALLYSLQNKADLAASEYEVALKNASKINPQNTEIYKSLGFLYIKQKRLKEAQGIFELVLSLSAKDYEAHFFLANVYDETQRRDLTVEELKKALELNPDYPEALNYLGYLYVEENKNLEQAEIMIKKALEFDPNNGAYLDSLGWLYFKQNKTTQAIELLEKAALLLQDPTIFNHLGDVYFGIKDFQAAKTNWEKSLKLEPNQLAVKAKIEELYKPVTSNW